MRFAAFSLASRSVPIVVSHALICILAINSDLRSEDNAEDRMAEFLVHSQSLLEKPMECLYERTWMREHLATTREVTAIGRLVYGRSMAVKRIDERRRLSTLSFNVTGNKAQTEAFREIAGPHYYRLESVFSGQDGFYNRRGDDNSKIIDRQLDLEGNPSFVKQCRWLNPLALIATDYGGQLGDLLDVRNTLFVNGVVGRDIEKNPKDGLCSAVLVAKFGTGAVRIIFDPKVPWLPIESQFKISRNGTKWRPGMSLDVLEKWDTYNVTTCRWQEVSGQYVPLAVKFDYSSNATGARAVTEYLFSDWRFGNEVNLDLLDREKFCNLETMNRPDFDRVESRFTELRKKLGAR